MILLAACSAAAGEGRRAPAPEEAYTLRRLIARSEIIVVGRALPSAGHKAGDAVRAASVKDEGLLKGQLPEGGLRITSTGPPLPTGERAIWFLASRAGDGSYLVDHPQCAYDVMHVPRVKLALDKPKEVGLREYLREKDEKLAHLLAERREFRLDGGELKPRPIAGNLQITATPLKTKIHPGEDVSVVFVITNLGTGPVMEGFVGRSDFITLAPGKKMVRTLHYSPEHFPLLGKLGRLEALAIYRVKLGATKLDFEPWRGMLVSEPLAIEIVKW